MYGFVMTARRGTSIWRLGLAIGGLATGAAVPTAAASDATGTQCWTRAQLAGTASEHVIKSNVKQAYVPRPTGAFAKIASEFPELAGRAIRRVELPAGVKRIAMTFDLCEQPHEVAGYQGNIVDFLRASEVKATFFAGGKWLVTHAERASQLIGDPLFEVGSHGWEHRNQQILTPEVSRQEMDGAGLAYEEVRNGLKARACRDRLGQRAAFENAAPRQGLFRFPFGACSGDALKAARERGLLAIQWDVSSGDPWPPITADQIVSSVMRKAKPGSILLFHANGRGHKTDVAVPQIVRKLRAKGYEFVTVSELLRTPGAKIITSDTCFDAKPGDTDRYQDISRRLEAVYRRFYRSQSGQKQTGGAPKTTSAAR